VQHGRQFDVVIAYGWPTLPASIIAFIGLSVWLVYRGASNPTR
jgi:hypothetical protein